MPVQALNHVNIAAPAALLQEVRDFYVNVLGLVDGERPNISLPGYWLYGGGTPLLHLMEPRSEAPQAQRDTGAIDHIALSCTDLPAMLARIEQSGIAYRKREHPERGVAQVFLTDPAGVHIELNFQLQQ